MAATFAMMGCQNLAAPAEVMQHIVHVESGANPYAIGVVNGQLKRQPHNLDEALATVQMLQDKGYNFSVGLGQINRYNLAKYGLTTYAQAFQACPNLVASSNIFADCYDRAGGDWGDAFSCYYSGNFVRGYRDGYVQKIYESIGRSAPINGAVAIGTSRPIQWAATLNPPHTGHLNVAAPTVQGGPYRVAIRSSAIDTTTALVTAVAPTSDKISTTAGAATTEAPSMAQTDQRAPAANDGQGIFVPQVNSPNDSAPSPTDATAQKTDSTNSGQGGRDAAFVF